jgi:hypothetical protein
LKNLLTYLLSTVHLTENLADLNGPHRTIILVGSDQGIPKPLKGKPQYRLISFLLLLSESRSSSRKEFGTLTIPAQTRRQKAP